MSLIGWLTASVTDTTMALVEDGALLGPRQLDMGNSGLHHFLGLYSPFTEGQRPGISRSGGALGGNRVHPRKSEQLPITRTMFVAYWHSIVSESWL